MNLKVSDYICEIELNISRALLILGQMHPQDIEHDVWNVHPELVSGCETSRKARGMEPLVEGAISV